MKVVGLTGGIAMGKSTVAGTFRRAGIAVFDADAEVHRLQGANGAALPAIAAAFPGVVTRHGVDRAALRGAVLGSAAALGRLERIMHPLVRLMCRRFVAARRRAGDRVVVLDIPLLFETGAEREVDVVVVVSAPAGVQRARLRRRGGMTEDQAAAVVRCQMPDGDKRRRADHVVNTGLSRRHAVSQTRKLIAGLR